jgi:hypothetical protein
MAAAELARGELGVTLQASGWRAEAAEPPVAAAGATLR